MADCQTEGKTFFTDLARYPAPLENGDYELIPVLDVANSFLPFFDVFGTMLKICKNDIEGNVTKLRNKSALVPQAKTFRELLQYELDNNESQQKESACLAALWFKRGLQYIAAFLEEFQGRSEENLAPSLDAAYERTLKKYHGWIVQKGIMMVSRMVPYKKDVLFRLCNNTDGLDQQCLDEVLDYLKNLTHLRDYLHNLIIDMGLDSEVKV